MKITVSSSMKFRDMIGETLSGLAAAGHQGAFPNLDSPQSAEDDPAVKRQLCEAHFQAIADADALYCLLPGGYMGTSVKIELGYALALRKPVYFSEATHDTGLDCLASGIVPLDALHLLPQST